MKANKDKDDLLLLIRQHKPMTTGQQLRLMLQLSTPAILSQLTTTAMQYIDASMVGSMGAEASAAIGLIESTTWLIGNICSAVAAGFYVQVAHLLGSNDSRQARSVVRQGITTAMSVSILIAVLSLAVSPFLPGWLGGNERICTMSSHYFAVVAGFVPVLMMNMLGAGMLRSSGNILVPSVLNVVMMVLDVVFNFFLIFPSRTVSLFGIDVFVPGAGLSVTGAALGTALAETISALLMMYFLCVRSGELRLTHEHGRFRPQVDCLRHAFHISAPMGLQQVIMCSAYIAMTVIIAPLGTYAIAANSFGVIIESLCYMPGFGIADAATTLVGQSMGAGRTDLMKRFAYFAVGMGMVVMTVMGGVMYVGAPFAMEMMTPVEEVRQLGVEVLRIEAFAEPMFAAAIVSYGIFVGTANTIIPSGMNLVSMWGVRIVLAALLAPSMGLKGVWMAMCAELCFRGFIFLCRLCWGNWGQKSVTQRR